MHPSHRCLEWRLGSCLKLLLDCPAERGIPKFRRRLQVTHPFTNKGLLPPVGAVIEIDDAIHGFWHVEASIIAHTYYDRETHGFTHRRELHIQGLSNPPIGMPLPLSDPMCRCLGTAVGR